MDISNEELLGHIPARPFRLVSEAAQDAYKSIYAYERQGDNLLLAREAFLFSFIEYCRIDLIK